MNNIIERLKNGETLVSDGAIGTMLLQKGFQVSKCPETVNLETPEVLEEIAGMYLAAGSDIIQTNTFGASPIKLSNYSYERLTEDINTRAVLAVRKAVGNKAYVSGSIGPSGRILKPYGETDPSEVYSSFKRQITALKDAGVDLICIETMTAIEEITLAIEAVKEVSEKLPIIATMTFDSTPRGFYTMMGINVEKAADCLKKAGADIIGSNCGNGSENMLKIAKEFKNHSDLPIIIQSNAGLPITQNGTLTYPESPEIMSNFALQLKELGISIIGGCCGTTPEHIKAIKDSLT